MNAHLQKFLFHLRFDPNENEPHGRLPVTAMSFTAPDLTRIWGVDVSGRWDGNVDFTVTKAQGGKFAIIKCTDGTVGTPFFRENALRSLAAGLLTGAYHWLYPNWAVSVVLQAQAAWNAVKSLGLTIPLTVDFEWTRYAGQSANPNYQDLEGFVREYIRLSGSKPILYSAAGYMNLFGQMPAALRDLFFGFWWANYEVASPSLPLGFNHWDIWQFTASGDALKYAPGDQGKLELDLNYMTEVFYDRLGGQLPPGEQPMTEKWKVVWPKGVARRTAPTTNNSYTGLSYAVDQVVDVIEKNIPDSSDPTNPNKVWVKFADGYFGASAYPDSLGQPQVRMVPVDAPPPPPPPSKIAKAVLYDDQGNVIEELFP